MEMGGFRDQGVKTGRFRDMQCGSSWIWIQPLPLDLVFCNKDENQGKNHIVYFTGLRIIIMIIIIFQFQLFCVVNLQKSYNFLCIKHGKYKG